MAVEPGDLRTCLGHFATGVTVITCSDGEQVHGLTVNSFTAVSLSPPLVLVSIDRRAKALEKLRSNRFTVNVLSSEQAAHAQHFAGRPDDALDLGWEEGPSGRRLSNCLAYVGCSPWRDYDGGDHVLFLGMVEQIEWCRSKPLLFYRGGFGSLSTFDEIERSLWELEATPGWMSAGGLVVPQLEQ